MTIITILVISMLYVLMGRFKGIADTIQHSEEYRTHGWEAKWKTDENGEVIEDMDGNRIEKFRFSSSFLVFLTDEWHLANFCQYRLQDLITWLLITKFTDSYWSFLAFILLPLLRYFGFKTSYRK
nr:hypothetical protein [uncultured Flavobacterium sp.]